jgi:hypothetical protein
MWRDGVWSLSHRFAHRVREAGPTTRVVEEPRVALVDPAIQDQLGPCCDVAHPAGCRGGGLAGCGLHPARQRIEDRPFVLVQPRLAEIRIVVDELGQCSVAGRQGHASEALRDQGRGCQRVGDAGRPADRAEPREGGIPWK